MVRSYGFSALDTILVTITVWCCAGLFIFLFGISSNRMGKRGRYVIASFIIASIELRATTLAMLVMIGQAMSIASAQVYSDAPYYTRRNSPHAHQIPIAGLPE